MNKESCQTPTITRPEGKYALSQPIQNHSFTRPSGSNMKSEAGLMKCNKGADLPMHPVTPDLEVSNHPGQGHQRIVQWINTPQRNGGVAELPSWPLRNVVFQELA